MSILTNNVRTTKMVAVRVNEREDLEVICSITNRRFVLTIKERNIVMSIPGMPGVDPHEVSFEADNSEFVEMIKSISAASMLAVFVAAGYKPVGGNVLQMKDMLSTWKDILDEETKELVREHLGSMEKSAQAVLTEFFEGLSRKA